MRIPAMKCPHCESDRVSTTNKLALYCCDCGRVTARTGKVHKAAVEDADAEKFRGREHLERDYNGKLDNEDNTKDVLDDKGQ